MGGACWLGVIGSIALLWSCIPCSLSLYRCYKHLICFIIDQSSYGIGDSTFVDLHILAYICIMVKYGIVTLQQRIRQRCRRQLGYDVELPPLPPEATEEGPVSVISILLHIISCT